MLAAFRIAILALFLAGCSALDALDAITPSGGYATTRDVAFGAHPRQKLDVYAPKDARDAPVIVFWYGGAWRRGERAQYRFVAEALVREGFVVVLPDYRLAPEARFPDFLDDGALALRWTLDNIAAHGGDPARLHAMGHSAGAYNAAMLALDPVYAARAGFAADAIKGVVALSGPFDFLPLRGRLLNAVFGAADPLENTQPVALARAAAPRFLLVHGARDTLVPPEQAIRMAEALRDSGGRAELRIYPDVAHIDMVLGLSTRLRGRSPLMADIAAFVRGGPNALALAAE